MIYFTAHTFKCVCHCRRAMFIVLGMYNFGFCLVKGCLKHAIQELFFAPFIFNCLKIMKSLLYDFEVRNFAAFCKKTF